MAKQIRDKAHLKEVYAQCKALKRPTKPESLERGYQLEKILEFVLQDLEPQAAYKPKGEQVDGSFFWNGQTFLLEAKWHAKKLPASDIYAFKGKVDGKFHTTSGIFLSCSGYSDDAVDALRYGKVVNVLLFDQTDLDVIIENNIPFIDVLKYKLRSAGDSGDPYVRYNLRSPARERAKPVERTVSEHRPKDDEADFGSASDPMFLLVSTLQLSERTLQDMIKQLDLHEPISMQFKVVSNRQFIPQMLRASSMALASDPTKNFMGAILLVSEKQFDQYAQDYLHEVLHKNSIAIDLCVVRLPEHQPGSNLLSLSSRNAKQISTFVNELLANGTAFYNLLGAKNMLRKKLNGADWDATDKTVTLIDEATGMPFKIDNFSDLQSHLSDLACNTASEETPLEILKDTEHEQDFDDLALEILAEFRHRLNELGWGDEL